MKTIIVATDFSSAAANAADYATRMAMCLHKEIHLLHVFAPHLLYTDMSLLAADENLEEQAYASLKKLEEHLHELTGGKILITTELRKGLFFDQLKQTCEREKPYAVVMGSQGAHASENFFFGGHTVYAMKHLQWPLITVPPKAHFTSVYKIALACDFEKVIDGAPIAAVKVWTKDLQAELHVLNVTPKICFSLDNVMERASLHKMLDDLKPEYHSINNSNTDKALVDFVKARHCSLLIVLPRQHGLLDRVFHRSHAKRLILTSDVPVMALHQ